MTNHQVTVSAEEIADVRRRIAEQLADGQLIPEPDGYYSFPCVLGGLWTETGWPEIVGYYPTKVKPS